MEIIIRSVLNIMMMRQYVKDLVSWFLENNYGHFCRKFCEVFATVFPSFVVCERSEVCDYLHFCFALIFHPCIETMFCGWCWHRVWIQTMICGRGSLFMRIDLVWNSIWTLDQRFCHPISTSKSTWISIKYMFAHCMYHHHCPNPGWHVVWIQYKRACSACDLSAILYAITAFIITIHHHPHPNCRHHHCHHHHLPHHHPSHRHHQRHPSTDCVNSIYASLLHAWPICPGRRRYLGAVIT